MSIFGAALCLLIYRCGREFFGVLGGLLAETVAAFDRIFSLTRALVTSDVPAAFFFNGAVWEQLALVPKDFADAVWRSAALCLVRAFSDKVLRTQLFSRSWHDVDLARFLAASDRAAVRTIPNRAERKDGKKPRTSSDPRNADVRRLSPSFRQLDSELSNCSSTDAARNLASIDIVPTPGEQIVRELSQKKPDRHNAAIANRIGEIFWNKRQLLKCGP